MGELVEQEIEGIAASDQISEALEEETRQDHVKWDRARERTEEKKRFRLAALARRDSLTAEQRRDYSGRMIKNLINLPCFHDADAILTYVSFRSEVDTFPLMELAFAEGKAVFVPKVMGKEMAFYRIFSVKDLAAGYRGILEPAGGMLYDEWIVDQTSQRMGSQQEKLLADKETEDDRADAPSILICIPGAAFDRARHRIGYGGGFYDRYLNRMLGSGEKRAEKAHRQAKVSTAALAFDCQLFAAIPWEAHDVCPEQIITEKEII